jgi:hypothetical protein
MTVASMSWVVSIRHHGDTLPPANDELAEQIRAATGCAVSVVGSGTDVHLPFEHLPEPAMVPLADTDTLLASHVTVTALVGDFPAAGLMPLVGFTFTGPAGQRDVHVLGDDRILRELATLVTNATASAVSACTKQRHALGQGQIPRGAA